MITEILGLVGKAMIGVPDLEIAQQSDPIRLRMRLDNELNLAAGCAGLFFVGFLLVVLRRRAARLERGKSLEDPLRETFWTNSSDLDLIFQLAFGLAALVITYVS